MLMPSLGSRRTTLALALAFAGLACDGAIGDHGKPSVTGSGGSGRRRNGGPTMVDPGKVTVPPTPIDAKTAFYATSKVKNLLTGMPPTDEDVAQGHHQRRRRAAGAGRRRG